MLKNIHKWQGLPNRDESLDIIFNFIKGLSESNLDEAESWVQLADIEAFKSVLDEGLKSYLMMIVDDKEMDELLLTNLAFKVTDPHGRDEDAMDPQFSKNGFLLESQEIVSLKLFLNEQITPVRLHFRVEGNEGNGYFMKLVRITADK